MTKWLPVRWQIAVALCLVTAINYIDRSALSFAAPVLLQELDISNTQYGLIASGFFWAYALGQVFSGRAIDLIGTKLSFSIAVLVWNLASAAHALSQGFLSLLGFRMILGIGEAANFPAALKAVSEWFPSRERSLATGIITMGPGLGNIIAPLLITFLILTVGWRWAFVVSGTIGIAWLFIWQYVYHSVEQHPRISDAERSMILAERKIERAATELQGFSGSDERPAWLSFLRYREMWGIMFSRFSSDGAFYFFVMFLPLYLATQRGLDLGQIAIAAMIPWIAADIGSFFGGWLGKRLIEAGLTLNAARKTVIWLGALLVLPVTLGALVVESVVAAVALIAVAMFAIQVKSSNLFVLPADLFQSRDVATVWGLFGAFGSIGGALFQALVGWLIDHVSWSPVFVVVALMHVVSALGIMIFVPRISQLPPLRR